MAEEMVLEIMPQSKGITVDKTDKYRELFSKLFRKKKEPAAYVGRHSVRQELKEIRAKQAEEWIG